MKDVIVIGNGPAGWAAAGACCDRGLKVGLIAPDVQERFRNGYGAWLDELEPIGFQEVVQRSWPKTKVVISDEEQRLFDRTYCRIDNTLLFELLTSRASQAQLIEDRIDAVKVDDSEGVLTALGAGAHKARLIIDATGHKSRLTKPGPGLEPGWQVAYGQRLRVRHHPFPLGQALLMDFRPADASEGADREPPTFLYALPEDAQHVFVEETSLASRPSLSMERIQSRLQHRLRSLGLSEGEVLEEEFCYVPMGGPAAPPVQPVVGFGGAAWMVHPASGYMLTRALQSAPRLGEVAARTLGQDMDVLERAKTVWQAIWPASLRGARDLQRFGTEVLLGLSTKQTTQFFEAFFRMPQSAWAAYMGPEPTPGQVRSAMLHTFGRTTWALRGRLVMSALGREGTPFWRSVAAR